MDLRLQWKVILKFPEAISIQTLESIKIHQLSKLNFRKNCQQ